MLSFGQFNDAIDKPYPWSWVNRDQNRHAAAFNVSDLVIEAAFQGQDGNYGFSLRPNRATTTSWSESTQIVNGVMSTGGSFRAIATALDVLKSFLLEQSPRKVTLSLNESRARTYRSLVKQFPSILRGYRSTEGPHNTFTITPYF